MVLGPLDYEDGVPGRVLGMETSGTTPATGVTSPELVELVQGNGPFASIYLTTEAEIDNAAPRAEQRWKTLRSQLADAGIVEEVLAQVDPLVPDAHREGNCLAVIADLTGIRHAEHLAAPPPQDWFTMAAVPSIAPIIEDRQAAVPYVVVLADRTGADITLVRRGREDVEREVQGDEYPISKTSAGGWSMRRFQQRAENTWEQNAEDVAKEVTMLAERADVALVLLGGDVRAVQLLQEALPPSIVEITEVIDGARAEDGSRDFVQAEVDALVRTMAGRATAELLEKFREERGQDDRAADGPVRTMEALTAAQVDVLLVHPQPDDDRRAWCGPDPIPVSGSTEDLRGLGVAEPVDAPLVDVLVRAALGTGASVRVIPGSDGPREGVGAILRWA